MRTLARLLLVTAACCPLLCVAQASAATQPDATQPPANQHAILTVQGRGAQIYGCQPVGNTLQWVFQAPVARLFDPSGNEVGTHGDGPVWNYQDSSSIQGTLLAKKPSPDADSIPWLLLKAVNPQRTGILTTVEFIARSDTKGGIAPTTGCDAAHQGQLSYIPYTATYTFYSSSPAKN
ncbi:DUF3455 domain-containing protein [Granulicella arctica]|uniref:DUF3455 domain-containing protein n=1 Tax=Granulicella arctica TaxID=940613 RepID=A0A7Y9PG23_9BACT|nr:DUF3455 domain-containing protein [Granulicella arctica]NYF79253.1 hypothetical protein [Granulicella arctica]